jgi:hypothetical protein
MAGNDDFERQVRTWMAATGASYSEARQHVQREQMVSTEELERMIVDIRSDLGVGWNRLLVPNGFTADVDDGGIVNVEMPVIWAPKPGGWQAEASEDYTTDEVDALRGVFEEKLSSGAYWPNFRVADWDAAIEDGERPGNLNWKIGVRVSG